MEIVIGCLLSFLCGMACTLTAQSLHVEGKRTYTTTKSADTQDVNSRHDEKIREQWESFLNYNGDEKGGEG